MKILATPTLIHRFKFSTKTTGNLANLLLLLPIFMLQVACDRVTDETIQQVSEGVTQTVNSAKEGIESLKPHIQTRTSEEFEKLFIFEYKVKELPIAATSASIEAELTLLGSDRWECYAVQTFDDHLRLFLKRRPESYLRYIPRVFP